MTLTEQLQACEDAVTDLTAEVNALRARAAAAEAERDNARAELANLLCIIEDVCEAEVDSIAVRDLREWFAAHTPEPPHES
jgi:hypothetical protein